MNNCHNLFLPSCGVWIWLSHRAFDIFWVNIGPSTPISIFHDSDSAPWWSQNSRKMSKAPQIWRITTIPPPPSCRLWISLSHRAFEIFSMLILIKLQQFPFHMTQIQCLDDHKTVGKWPMLNKYKWLPQYVSPIL